MHTLRSALLNRLCQCAKKAKCNDSTLAQLDQVSDDRYTVQTACTFPGRIGGATACNDSTKCCTISGAQFQVHNFRCTFGCSISRCKRRIDRAKACNSEPHLAWCNYSIPLPPLHCTLIQKSRPVNPLWVAKYRGNPYKLLGEPNWKT